MSRKKGNYIRKIEPDYYYKSELVARMINKVMMNGKKALAIRIVYQSMEYLKKKLKLKDDTEVLKAFEKCVKNVIPLVEVISRRVGGSTYQVPSNVNQRRSITLALRWIVHYAKKKHGKSMLEGMSLELLDAYNETGLSVKKKEEVHKMAESNKAFSHFRW